MTRLGRYIKKNGHPYRLRRRNGKGVMEIQFHDGYVTIKNMQPGSRKFVQEIHITRSAWHTLVESPQLHTATKSMEGPDFDRYAAERKYYREEQELLSELRDQKAERRGKKRRRRRS